MERHEWIRVIRKSKGHTKERAARAIRISPSQYGLIEKNEVRMHPATAKKVARYCGVRPIDIMVPEARRLKETFPDMRLWLYARRLEMGLCIDEASALCGISAQAYRDIEHSTRYARKLTQEAVAEAMSINADWFTAPPPEEELKEVWK